TAGREAVAILAITSVRPDHGGFGLRRGILLEPGDWDGDFGGDVPEHCHVLPGEGGGADGGSVTAQPVAAEPDWFCRRDVVCGLLCLAGGFLRDLHGRWHGHF